LSEKERKLIDASNQIAGRLASRISKLLLDGSTIDVINIESAVISGKPTKLADKFQEYLEKGSLINPKYGPIHYRRPDMLFRKMVKGMLPRRKRKGKDALAHLRAYIGHPSSIKGTPMRFDDADVSRLSGYYTTLGELASRFSRWKEEQVTA
jgi:large subunit ribosomal protein L13